MTCFKLPSHLALTHRAGVARCFPGLLAFALIGCGGDDAVSGSTAASGYGDSDGGTGSYPDSGSATDATGAGTTGGDAGEVDTDGPTETTDTTGEPQSCVAEEDVVLFLSPDDSNSMSSPVQAREAASLGPSSLRWAPIRVWEFMNYYNFDYPAAEDGTLALSAQLRTRLDDAVAANMVSDVPVGAFLSGGLDSSLVVALMARQSDRPVQTHSIGFREASYNELPWARRVAAHCGTEHHETIVEPNIEDLIHELVGAFDEPFGDSSAVAAWAPCSR